MVMGVFASAVLSLSASAAIPNNRRPGLLPPQGGAWRGAELGPQFAARSGTSKPTGAEKLAGYHQAYPQTPLHVYRSFSMGDIEPGVRKWVAEGGILWYNIKSGDRMSWAKGARGGFDVEARSWAAQVRSLAPAQVIVCIYHEPDHNVCFENCTRGGVPGNTPANYRGMWRSIQAVFKSEGVTNAIWAMDFSVQIGANVAEMDEECSDVSCPAA
eukprot:SAG31_NODE_12557_length_932_cov_1.968788_1_plen_213_part_01